MAQTPGRGDGASTGSSGNRGSIHGRVHGQAPELTAAQLFPHKSIATRGKKGRTKHGKVGMHGRSPISAEAKIDPFKHKFQARRQG